MEVESQQLPETLPGSLTSLIIGLAVAMVILALVMHLLRSWYRGSDDPADGANELLQQMREMHLQGDLSEEEFRSIKSQFHRRTET